MAIQVPKITLAPAPQLANTLEDYKRSVEEWTREAQLVIRQLETALRALVVATGND